MEFKELDELVEEMKRLEGKYNLSCAGVQTLFILGILKELKEINKNLKGLKYI